MPTKFLINKSYRHFSLLSGWTRSGGAAMSLFHLLFILSLSQTSTQGSALPQSPPAAVAAAGPILQDRPFVVVWNMPTAQCKRRYNIDLDLGDFDIMENRHQSFQGEVTVLRDAFTASDFHRDFQRDTSIFLFM